MSSRFDTNELQHSNVKKVTKPEENQPKEVSSKTPTSLLIYIFSINYVTRGNTLHNERTYIHSGHVIDVS